MRSTKAWLRLFGAVALLCAAAIAVLTLTGGQGVRAQVLQGGRLVYTLDLNGSRTVTVTAPNGGTNTITVESGRVCMSHASCPDQLCVRQGWVSGGAVPIVCLPNQLVIQIKGGESELDAATG